MILRPFETLSSPRVEKIYEPLFKLVGVCLPINIQENKIFSDLSFEGVALAQHFMGTLMRVCCDSFSIA